MCYVVDDKEREREKERDFELSYPFLFIYLMKLMLFSRKYSLFNNSNFEFFKYYNFAINNTINVF